MTSRWDDLRQRLEKVRVLHAQELLDALPHLPEQITLTSELCAGYRWLTAMYVTISHRVYRSFEERNWRASDVAALAGQARRIHALLRVIQHYIIALRLREHQLQARGEVSDLELVERAERDAEDLLEDVRRV